LTAHGTIPLGPGDIDVRLDGTINMGMLQALNSKISGRGILSLNLNASGPISQPVLQGKLDVKDGFINHSELPSGLSELNGVILFDQSRGRIENLTGKIGGGTVTLTGTAGYANGALSLDLAARGRQVRLRYPPGVSSTANLNLRLNGTTNSATLSGEVLVTKLVVTPGFDFGSYLGKSKVSSLVVPQNTLANRVKLDIHTTTASELQMQTAVAKLSGSADLRLRGTVDRPVITGRASANGSEGDEITFNGNKFRAERLEVTFANPTKTEPVVDLQATTRVRDTDITIILSGPPDNLTSKFRSDPPLPQADIINLLALGHTQEESAALQANGGSPLSGTLTNALIGEALNTAVTSRVQRLFGVSRIKIDPQGTASTTNLLRGPQVTVEQQIANKLTITYSTNVSVSSQQSIEAEYSVSRNVSIVALRDQNGVVSFDLKIRQRKR